MCPRPASSLVALALLLPAVAPFGASAVALSSQDTGGHRVSPVSASWGGQVVYGVFTSSLENYRAGLVAELETWGARPRAEGRFVAMGGRSYPADWQEPGSILASNCGDGPGGLSCKEAWLLAEGYARGAAWLVILGEDHWVDTEALEAQLRSRGSLGPLALGCVGCGTGLGEFCPEVNERGGFCGGCAYALNRAIVESLLAKGSSALKAEYAKQDWPNDMQTSCSLRQRGHELEQWSSGFHGGSICSQKEFLLLLADSAVLFHYVSPPLMRWLHTVATACNGSRGAGIVHAAATTPAALAFEELPTKDMLPRCQNHPPS